MTNKSPLNIPNSVTRTLVCVDALSSSDFSGTLYNPYMPAPVHYREAKDIITSLEGFFNDICYPQSYFKDRSFLGDKPEQEEKQPVPVHRYMEDDIFTQHKGRVATFEIEVKYRQNASWQGDFIWLDRDEHFSFRSTLEALKLMDAALQRAVAGGGQ